MIQNFEDKFNELVLDPTEAQLALQQLTNRIVKSYSSAIGTKFALVKNLYKIPDRDWERYINDIASITYSTGTSRSSLASGSIANGLINDLLVVTTAAIGSKVALNIASKAAAKIAGKVAGAVAAKIGANAPYKIGYFFIWKFLNRQTRQFKLLRLYPILTDELNHT